MRLNKPYTNKEYAQFADSCNQQGLLIEAKNDYLEGKLIILPESTYREKRLSEYPPLGEQLDMIYHDFEGWKSSISLIKTKYPKE